MAGFYYELAIELTSRADDTSLRRGISALLASPEVCGPWLRREDIGDAEVAIEELQLGPELLACCTLRTGSDDELGCAIHTVHDEEGSTWLDLCVPTGMLEVKYPLTRRTNPWMDSVDCALLNIADQVYRAIPFDLAMLGEECSGSVCAKELSDSHLERGQYLLSPRLFSRLHPRTEVRQRPSGLFHIATAEE